MRPPVPAGEIVLGDEMNSRRTARPRAFALASLGVAAATTASIAGFVTTSFASGVGKAPVATVKAPYSCSSPIGSVSAPVTVTGTTPSTASALTAVKMRGYQVKVHIPATDVNKVISLTHARSAKGTVTNLDVKSTDAKPINVNAAHKPISFGPVALVMNKALTIAVPATPARIGSWVAQTAGTMTFSPGPMALTIEVGTFTVKATCKPTSTVTLSTTTVS